MKLFGNKKPEKRSHIPNAESHADLSGDAAAPGHAHARSAAPSHAHAAGGAHSVAKKNNADPKKRKALRRALTVLGVIVLAVVGVVVAYSVWEKPPDIAGSKNTPSIAATPKPTPTPSATAPVDPEDTPEPTAEPYDDPDIDPFDGALFTERDNGIYTFLLVGRDYESNSTDTILVGRLDTNEHTINCINIPRDTLINISWADTPKKINAVFPGYYNSGRDAVGGLKTHIKNLIGFEVDCYAIVNLNVVESVINEIGGVYFDVPINMDYDDPSQNFHVHIKKGYQLLDGYNALGVFRFRYGNYGQGTYPGGDIERIGVQQSLLKAIATQMLSLGNIPNLANIIQLCLDNVETDLDASNMAFFARQFLLCSADNINFHTAPVGSGTTINNISFVSLNVNQWLEMINECINPYKDPVTTANVNILVTDSIGLNMTSTTGNLSGGLDSFACNMPGCKLRFSHHAPSAHIYEDDEKGDDKPATTPGGEEQGGEVVDAGQEQGGQTGGDTNGETGGDTNGDSGGGTSGDTGGGTGGDSGGDSGGEAPAAGVLPAEPNE